MRLEKAMESFQEDVRMGQSQSESDVSFAGDFDNQKMMKLLDEIARKNKEADRLMGMAQDKFRECTDILMFLTRQFPIQKDWTEIVNYLGQLTGNANRARDNIMFLVQKLKKSVSR